MGGEKIIRIAVVDDEAPICEQMISILEEIDSSLKLDFEIGPYYSGEALIKDLKAGEKYELIFLDIELIKMNGIDVSRFIRDELIDDSTQIVFVSGKNGYDRMLFEFRPINFIEKPVTLDKIMNVISKYLRIYSLNKEFFQYKVNRDNFLVKIDEILYFKSDDRKVIIALNSKTDDFYGSLENVAKQIKGKGFFSPHRSYLVNYKFVRCFQSKKIVMTNDDVIPISDKNRDEVCRIQIMLENGDRFYGI